SGPHPGMDLRGGGVPAGRRPAADPARTRAPRVVVRPLVAMGDDGGLESIARLAHLPPVAAVPCIGLRAHAPQPRRASRPRRDAAPFGREALMTAAAFARASGLALALCCTSVTAPAQTQAPSPESTWQPSVW